MRTGRRDGGDVPASARLHGGGWLKRSILVSYVSPHTPALKPAPTASNSHARMASAVAAAAVQPRCSSATGASRSSRAVPLAGEWWRSSACCSANAAAIAACLRAGPLPTNWRHAWCQWAAHCAWGAARQKSLEPPPLPTRPDDTHATPRLPPAVAAAGRQQQRRVGRQAGCLRVQALLTAEKSELDVSKVGAGL